MARSGTYGTKHNKVEDCRQWPMYHQGTTGVSKQASNRQSKDIHLRWSTWSSNWVHPGRIAQSL